MLDCIYVHSAYPHILCLGKCRDFSILPETVCHICSSRYRYGLFTVYDGFCMFRLLLRCQECGRTWHSSPVRFSKAGTTPETEGMRAVFRTLYEREREAAREKAAAEALEIFS